jgi:hypothetical protein
MSSDILIINPINYPDWDDLIRDTEGDVFSNTSAWANTLYESYRYKPLYFSIFKDSRLSALLPVMEVNSRLTGRRGVSLPFTDYCNPIIEDEQQFRDLFDHVVSYGKERGWKYFEFRDAGEYLKGVNPGAKYFGHILDLVEDEEQIVPQLRQSTRRNIKKAVQKEVSVSFSSSLEALRKYYKLHCITRKRQGVPPQPFAFFKNIHDHIISSGLGTIILGIYQNEVIAGAVFFHSGRTAFYKYGASDKRYQNLRANNLIIWEAIKWHCRNSYTSLCFGRTDMDEHGLRQFKLGWGVKERIITYYIYDLEKNTFVEKVKRSRPLYNQIFGKMPVSLLRLSGKLLYKHMG